jgi:hypothetical protein
MITLGRFQSSEPSGSSWCAGVVSLRRRLGQLTPLNWRVIRAVVSVTVHASGFRLKSRAHRSQAENTRQARCTF